MKLNDSADSAVKMLGELLATGSYRYVQHTASVTEAFQGICCSRSASKAKSHIFLF